MSRKAFLSVVSRAITDMMEHGYDSPERLQQWLEALRRSAEDSLTPAHRLEEDLQRALGSLYHRLVDREGIHKYHQGVAKFTVDRLQPSLRAELQRRLHAASQLIRNNRKEAVAKTLQRFAAWGTSVPKGGSEILSRPVVKTQMRKALVSLPYEERRVIIDQSAKMRSALSEIIANDGGAIAARWHSKWRQAGYDYREDHKDRDEDVFLIRDSWAMKLGYLKPGRAGFTDDVTKPGEEVFCQCWYEYLYNIRDLPSAMLTKKGREKLEEVRRIIAA